MIRDWFLFVLYRSGDVIVEVDGKHVKGVRDVLDAIGFDIGRTISFVVLRPNRGEVSVTFTLEAAK